VRLHPGHELAQLAAGLLDRVGLTLLAELEQRISQVRTFLCLHLLICYHCPFLI
jgi:hypothetical protein